MPSPSMPPAAPQGSVEARLRRRVDAASVADRHSEQQALRAVFRQLGGTYRAHRRRTGAAVFAPLRSAAIAFRQEPSFSSLLPVATLMDEMTLLEW